MSVKRCESGKTSTLLLVVLLLIAAAAGGAYFLSSDPDLDSAPAEDVARESPDGPDETSPSPTPSVESFGWGEVLLEVEREEGINVYFVNEGRVTFADVVLRCVNEYRKDFDSVSCYGFPSSEAFTTAEIDPETGSIGKKCWQAYYSVSGRGRSEKESGGAIDNGQAGELGCPTT